MRLRSCVIPSGSHLSFFHTLFTFPLTPPRPDLSSPYWSSVFSRSFRRFMQPCSISFRSAFCSLRRSRSAMSTSISLRTIERLLILFYHRSQQCSKFGIQGDGLVRNSLELTGRVDKVLANFVGKPNYRDEVAYTKTEAHRDIKHNSGISTLAGRLGESGMRERRRRKSRERMKTDCVAALQEPLSVLSLTSCSSGIALARQTRA